jgi:hypothetical protein
MHRKHGWLGLAALGAVLAGIGAAGAADVYKDREALMKGFGQRMNVIKGAVVEGKGTLVDAATAAQEITANANAVHLSLDSVHLSSGRLEKSLFCKAFQNDLSRLGNLM